MFLQQASDSPRGLDPLGTREATQPDNPALLSLLVAKEVLGFCKTTKLLQILSYNQNCTKHLLGSYHFIQRVKGMVSFLNKGMHIVCSSSV